MKSIDVHCVDVHSVDMQGEAVHSMCIHMQHGRVQRSAWPGMDKHVVDVQNMDVRIVKAFNVNGPLTYS
jgi:hypothetical protein